MKKNHVILASQSQNRNKIFKTLNIEYDVVPADIDEKKVDASSLAIRAKKIAWLKAEKVSFDYPKSIIIAGDTYSELDGRALEKPLDKDDASEMLKKMSGRKMTAYTGFAYIDRKNKLEFRQVCAMPFKFRQITSQEISDYVASNPVLSWSAAFSPAHPAGAALLEEMSGSFTAFAYGLPIELVSKYLKLSGVL